MPRTSHQSPFDYQGKREDQVSFSEAIGVLALDVLLVISILAAVFA